MSRTNRPPISLARLVRKMNVKGYEGKIAVVVGSITDDVRVFEVPALKVCVCPCHWNSSDLLFIVLWNVRLC